MTTTPTPTLLEAVDSLTKDEARNPLTIAFIYSLAILDDINRYAINMDDLTDSTLGEIISILQDIKELQFASKVHSSKFEKSGHTDLGIPRRARVQSLGRSRRGCDAAIRRSTRGTGAEGKMNDILDRQPVRALRDTTVFASDGSSWVAPSRHQWREYNGTHPTVGAERVTNQKPPEPQVTRVKIHNQFPVS